MGRIIALGSNPKLLRDIVVRGTNGLVLLNGVTLPQGQDLTSLMEQLLQQPFYFFQVDATTFRPYATVAEALATVPLGERTGRTINIAGREWWWVFGDTSDAGLQLKGGGSTNSSEQTHLHIRSTNGVRVAELQLVGPLTLEAEIMEANVAVVDYQLDRKTRGSIANRVYGNPNQPRAAVQAVIDLLNPADYDEGVRLYVRTAASSTPDPSILLLRLNTAGPVVYVNTIRNDFPLPAAERSYLRNSEFNDPFTGDSNTGWQSSGGYTWNNAGYVEAVATDGYLYQEITSDDPLVVGANYEVRVGITNYAQGQLAIEMVNGANTHPNNQDMAASGDFVFPFNAAASFMRFHLRGFNQFTGRIEYCRLVRV